MPAARTAPARRRRYGSETYGDPATVSYARTWALSTYGNWVIANPRGGTIYKWKRDTSADAAAVTIAPTIVAYAPTTPERQLLAFGCNEEASGDFNPLCIRGSDIEDITDWTTASNNNAFEHILEGGGRIEAARIVGATVTVWTQLLGGLASDYGAGTRADLATLAQLGDQQRGIAQAYATAPLAQLQAIGQLSGMTPYDILVGQATQGTQTGTGTTQGTSVTRETPSLFSQMLELGNFAKSFM